MESEGSRIEIDLEGTVENNIELKCLSDLNLLVII